jgi:hypothetical protein
MFGGQVDERGRIVLDDPQAFRRHLEHFSGKRVQVTVRKERHGRTLPQNRRLWLIYTAIADWSGHDAEEIHEACKGMFLPRRRLDMPKGYVLDAAPSTRLLNVEDFGEYMNRVERWALEQGCEMPDWDTVC